MISKNIKDSVISSALVWLTVLLPALIPVSAGAQYSTNSLYSFYGLGDINSSRTGKISGMGGAGIALKSEGFLNNLNPASFSTFDSTSFVFDFGLAGYYSSIRSQGENKSASDINFNNIAIGFPVTKWWGSSIGSAPFSTIGYNISTFIPVEGKMLDVETQFTGKGGINQFYFSNTFSLSRHLALGINLSYLMGSIIKNEINKLEPFGLDNLYTIRTRHFNNLYYSFGLQSGLKLNNDNLSLGVTFSPPQKIKTKYSVLVLIENADTLENRNEHIDDVLIPLALGIGVAYKFNSILDIAFDYSYQKWSDANYSMEGARLVNSYSYNFGLEYNQKQPLNATFLNLIIYRFGAYYEQTYLMMRNNAIKDYGINFGIGFPVKRQKSTINLTMGLGQLGTTSQSLVKQTYGSLKLSLTLHDYWFLKRKYD
jgi:hypothetical protein